MRTTNCCIVFLTGCVLLTFFGCAHSLKCYSCRATSEVECSENQTIIECKHSILQCATAQYIKYGPSYLKTCFPLAYSCAILNATNCSITHCTVDYCNGPTPTTPSQKPSQVTIPSEVATTKLTDSTPSHEIEHPKAAGSLLSSGYGLMALVFIFGKILEICTVS